MVMVVTLALVVSVGGAMAASYYDDFSGGLTPSGWNGGAGWSLITGTPNVYQCNTNGDTTSWNNWVIPSAWTYSADMALVAGYSSGGRGINADLRMNGTQGNFIADVLYMVDSEQYLINFQYYNGSSWTTVLSSGWSNSGAFTDSDVQVSATRNPGANTLIFQIASNGTTIYTGTTSAFSAGFLDGISMAGLRVYDGEANFKNVTLTDLTPVPEPSSILFMVPGVAGLLGLALRKRS